MQDAKELKSLLGQYTGCEQPFYRALFPHMLYTDGVKAFAENAGGGAYWFLDIIGSELEEIRKKEEFILVSLIVTEIGNDWGNKAVILADEGNGDDGRVFHRREIEHTDCPVGTWKFYYLPASATQSMLMLPGEY